MAPDCAPDPATEPGKQAWFARVGDYWLEGTGTHGLDITTSRRFGLGMQIRFPDFAAWAAARDDTYGLGEPRVPPRPG